MSGLLFVLDVVATVLIALWVWGVERSGEGWRVRLFDMDDQAAAKAEASMRAAPQWMGGKAGAETPAPAPEARPPASFRRAPAPPSSTPPRWRRRV
jgi:hypothetical protein